jgi:cell division protein FtsL
MSERRVRYYVDGSTVRVMPAPEKKRKTDGNQERTPNRNPNRNTNRKNSAAPARREAPNRRQNQNTDRRQAQERRVAKPVPARAQRALAFNFGYTVYVVAAVAIMIFACFAMLGMDSALNQKKQNIANLETQLEAIKDENTAYKVELENMYSLDDVYDIATNELGMVYAKKGQIVYYDSTNEDYVKQYQDVPEAD